MIKRYSIPFTKEIDKKPCKFNVSFNSKVSESIYVANKKRLIKYIMRIPPSETLWNN